MATHDYNIANDTGAAVRTDLNNVLSAIVTQNSNPTAPSTTFPRMFWLDTSVNLRKRRNAANSGWLVDGTLAETFVLSRSSNTILTAADYGRTIVATAGFTQTFDPASSLGDGWFVYYRNNSGGNTVTLDPNASEGIDGFTTLALWPGETVRIVCSGSAFFTIGKSNEPPGTIKDYGGTSAPNGYVLCNGQELGRVQFSALFAAIGTTWGIGDGSSTFNVPNLERRVTVGSGGLSAAQLGNTVGSTGGAEGHFLTVDEMPAHTHSIDSWDEFDPGTANSAGVNPSGGFNLISTNSAGGNQSHNNIQPSAVVTKIIKV